MSHQPLPASLPAIFIKACENPEFKGWFMRENGGWTHYSPADLREYLYNLSLALKGLNLEPGKSLGIIAPSSPQWTLFDLACQVCGTYIVPLFPNISSDNFAFQTADASVDLLVVHDIESLSAPIKEFASKFRTIIHLKSLPEHDRKPNFVSWSDLIEKGASLASPENEAWFASQIAGIKHSDVFSIIYTSGSTGLPKGVPLTQRNMVSQVVEVARYFPGNATHDSILSVLPVAHVFQRMVMYFGFWQSVPIYFADPNDLGAVLPEVRPTIVTVVPRIVEKLYEKLLGAADKVFGPKKWLLKWAIRVAQTSDPLEPNSLRKFFDPIVYKKMRSALGGRLRYLVSGSSALNPTIQKFLLNLGLPMYEGYGLTETSPVIAACNAAHLKLGTVGPALPHLEVKISPEGEVLVKGPSVFLGYHNRSDLDSEVFTTDGFFRTGDRGELDSDGYLKLTGRLKELFKTSTGKYVRPVLLETGLMRSRLIDAAQVFANNRKFVTALIFVNKDALRAMFKKTPEEFNVVRALASDRVNERIQKQINRVNAGVNEWEHIRKYKLLADDLDTESNLLTPTLKLRRSAVDKKYSSVMDELYV
jgi:long-chain acyl-CoA synthetase